jgi:hypothetical protein
MPKAMRDIGLLVVGKGEEAVQRWVRCGETRLGWHGRSGHSRLLGLAEELES